MRGFIVVFVYRNLSIGRNMFADIRQYLKKFYGKNKKLLLILFSVALVSGLFLIAAMQITGTYKPPSSTSSPPTPSVSIGCSQVIWGSKELNIEVQTSNIKNPVFQWFVDNKNSGNTSKIKQIFYNGSHYVIVNVSFGNRTLSASKQIVVINSTKGVLLRNFSASTNKWGFQTTYQGKDINVEGVQIVVDSLSPADIPACGPLTTGALRAGNHTWEASYQGKVIAQGNFELKEINELKINSFDIAPSYKVGDTVNSKVVLENKGTTTIKGFNIKTFVINNDYAWMGNVAKKEFYDSYDSELVPGQRYEIPIRVKIPESVGGIKPTGQYNLTITVILKNQVEADRRSFITQVN